MTNLQKNVLLKNHSNFKIGGNASYFSEVFSKEELIDVLKQWKETSLKDPEKIFILGGGTNVLFSDEGYDGLVIKDSIGGMDAVGQEVKVSAGVELSKFLDFLAEKSLSGFEWAGGLPGTVGGAIRGNAGAFGGEAKDNVKSVSSMDLETLQEREREIIDCEFSYRKSVFKGAAKGEIILSVIFSLENGDKNEIQAKTSEKIEHRKLKHPLEYPNLGSIFKNVPYEEFSSNLKNELSKYIKNDPFPVIPTAKLIFLAGLSGKRVGDVAVSEKHTNFIVNLGNGKASEVKELISIVRHKINEAYGVTLEEEIMYL